MAEQQKSGGNTALIIIIIVAVLAISAGAFYFLKYKPDQEAKEKARLEQLAKEKAEKEAAELEAQKKAKYDGLISNADAEYGLENWESAKEKYSEASNLYQNENYPIQQIDLINQKLAELAEIEANRVGEITMINRATGRFYVVLSSSIDDDLAMDFAKKLSKEKIDINILETHNATHTYFAVSPASFDTYGEAEAALADFSNYGEGIWVIKY